MVLEDPRNCSGILPGTTDDVVSRLQEELRYSRTLPHMHHFQKNHPSAVASFIICNLWYPVAIREIIHHRQLLVSTQPTRYTNLRETTLTDCVTALRIEQLQQALSLSEDVIIGGPFRATTSKWLLPEAVQPLVNHRHQE